MAVKCEATPGTDATPDATNAVVAYGVEISPLGKSTSLGRNVRVGEHWSAMPGKSGMRAGTVKCFVYLNGSGTAGTAPGYAPLMLACGMQQDIAAGPSVVMSPASAKVTGSWGATSDKHGWCPASVYVWQQDTAGGATAKLFKLTGCAGNVKLSGSTGKPIKVEFELMGVYATPTVTSMPSPTLTSHEAVAMRSQTFQVSTDGSTWHRPVVSAFGIDLGSRPYLKQRIGATSGYCSAELMGRKPTLTLTVEEPQTHSPGTGFDWWGAWESDTQILVDTPGFAANYTSGNRAQVDFPRFTLDKAPERQSSDGVTKYSLSATLDADDGDDEFTITYT